MKDKRKQPQWFRHFRAWIGAYYWKPCPLCQQFYGGHEWNGGHLDYNSQKGIGVCPNCRDYADELNAA